MYINKGKTMRKLYNMIALVLFSSLIFAVDGHHSVSGTVTDADGNALFGANVTVEGTSSGLQQELMDHIQSTVLRAELIQLLLHTLDMNLRVFL